MVGGPSPTECCSRLRRESEPLRGACWRRQSRCAFMAACDRMCQRLPGGLCCVGMEDARQEGPGIHIAASNLWRRHGLRGVSGSLGAQQTCSAPAPVHAGEDPQRFPRCSQSGARHGTAGSGRGNARGAARLPWRARHVPQHIGKSPVRINALPGPQNP